MSSGQRKQVFLGDKSKTFTNVFFIEDLVQKAAHWGGDVGEVVVLCWYVAGASYVSQPILLEEASARVLIHSVAFAVLSNYDPTTKVTLSMTLQTADATQQHVAVAFLQLSDLVNSEAFQHCQVSLRTQAGVLAVATVHAAKQVRWQAGAPVKEGPARFLGEEDGQAKQFLNYIFRAFKALRIEEIVRRRAKAAWLRS